MLSATRGFDGPIGKASAAVMARMNRDMEIAAADELEVEPTASVLAVGFGPGVGVDALAHRLPEGHICGIDPSAVMMAVATRRNRAAVEAGRVTLRRAGAESIPWPDGFFDAVVAVNCAQLWDPLETALAEIARATRDGGSLVLLTHRWAVERTGPADAWVARIRDLLAGHGVETTATTKPFRSGPGIVIVGSVERAERHARRERRARLTAPPPAGPRARAPGP